MPDIKKLTKAEAYSWTGIGLPNVSTAASYGVYDGGHQVAVISRSSGGEYMAPAHWECRNSQPQEYTCCLTGKPQTAKPGELVLASGPTLKAVKEAVVKKLR